MFAIGNDELEQISVAVYAGDKLESLIDGKIYTVENSKGDGNSNGTLQFVTISSGDSYLVGVWNKLVNKNFKLIKNG